MRPDKQLDYATFQLNPTRTRCELIIAAQGMTYKLAAGLLHPFVAHLKAAEEQMAGGGYSIRLEPPDPACAGWFTKGTLERFVRFVSTPEMLERISTIEMELLEIDKAIHSQPGDASEDSHYAEELLYKSAHSNKIPGGMALAPEHFEKLSKEFSKDAQVDSRETQQTTKQLLSRALKSQQMMLEKELEVALACAISAGFTVEHIKDLIVFGETFGAKRLWVACSSLLSLFKRRQQSGVWQDNPKLSVADSNASEPGFSGNMANLVGIRENLDLQGRAARHDNMRRASLPGEGKQGDNGLEKLTRRGSLDELTADFFQVAARMRSSGMLEVAHADRFNNWQPPIGGGSRSISGEMHVGAAYPGGNIDVRDGKGHPLVAAWKGPPQNLPMQNAHPLTHGTIPTSFGFQGLPVPGYSYPSISAGPYLGNVYAEANGWQFSSPTTPPFWPHTMHNSAAGVSVNEGAASCSTAQKQDGDGTLLRSNELHEQPTLLSQRLINESSNENKSLAKSDESHRNNSGNNRPKDNLSQKEVPASELSVADESPDTINQEPFNETSSCELSAVNEPAASTVRLDNIDKEFPKEATAVELSAVDESAVLIERPASKSLNPDKLHADSSQNSSIDRLSSDGIQQIGRSQHQPPITREDVEENTKDSSNNADGEPLSEKTRRLPIRSSSPSRRSASPLKKVQIGRSGSRRAIRGLSNVVQTISEKMDVEINDRDSSGSWSEDNDVSKNEEEPMEKPVRSSVQDVIGLFERKKDADDIKSNLVRKDIERIKSNNSVLKRWTDSAVIANEPMKPLEYVENQNGKGSAVVSSGDGSEMSSNKLNVSGTQDETISVSQEDRELLAAWDLESSSKQASVEQPGRKESKVIQKDSPISDSMLFSNERSDNNNLIHETRTISNGKAYNVPVNDDTHVLGADVVNGHQETRDESLNDKQQNDDDEEPEPAHLRKLSPRDEKAKLMQELLQRRKATWGNRAVKSNPLAEAQVRAEKLRAYKAGLQKSKQEKDEEEKKRLEDLKSQRKERIAARGGTLGGLCTPSPPSKQTPQTPPLATGNKSSPTVTSHKYSSPNSPRTPINLPPSSLSPILPKTRGFAGNNLPRRLAGSSKPNENSISHSVPSLSELKKKSPKAMTGFRSSTGSQRISQLKKDLKDADVDSSPKANGHSVEEKKRSLPLVTARKGNPPAKDTKNEAAHAVKKPTKNSLAANKQLKKLGNSLASVERPAGETFLEQVPAPGDAAVEESPAESGKNKRDISLYMSDGSLKKDSSLVQERGSTEVDNDHARSSVPVSSELRVADSIGDLPCLADGEFAASNEFFLSKDLEGMEDLMELENCCTDLTACIEGEHREQDMSGLESYCAPVAQEPHDFSKELDSSRENTNVALENSSSLYVSTNENPFSLTTEVCDPPVEAINPPQALPTDSSIDTPKNLPRLLEAIQQAHSPDFSQGAIGSRKVRQESGSMRSSKDHHAKGLKRLLFLGRKSSRSSFQNSGEWVSVSSMAEAGGGQYTSSDAGIGSATSATDIEFPQGDKSREGHFGSSSTKGSRSFFSLSTFRGKSDGK